MTRSDVTMLMKQSDSFSRKHRTPDFISADLCPPNSPVGYRICGPMHIVYATCLRH